MINHTSQRIAVGSRWRGFSRSQRMFCAFLASLQLLLPSVVVALPTDGIVVGGHAEIQQVSPTQLTIQQTTDRAILNWQSFSIGANETVRFDQPSINSIAMNRVTGIDPSVILGNLQANGRIFLLNPNGILFGAGAQINVGGLLATTLQIRDDDFMAGRFLFAQDPLKGLKSVVNQGTIRVSDHGFVVLAAPGVANEGLIVANLGKVVLGSGQALTVDLMGDGLIKYALSGKVLDQVMGVDGKPLSSAVSNTGTIQADGGHVILQAKASGDIFSSVVNQSGVIRARSLENHGGVVQLLGGDETLVAATLAGAMRPVGDVSGAVVNTGTIDVAAGEPNAARGSVTMVGARVGQFGSIMATGAEGANGGEVVIASTTRTLLASGSTIDVSGSGHSSGGRLRVWSDQDTFFDAGAAILARGGELGGNGGFVELSGKENLGYAGSVNALAPFGSAGTLLLDPRNITIAAAGAAYTPGVNNLFGNTPAVDVTISAGSINAAAANVVLQANNDITVGSAINMANAGVGIAMQAGRDINVNAAITTNNGNISLTANDSSAIAANRLAGTGDIVFGVAGANLSAGTGNIDLTIGSSAAAPFNPGSITTVRNLTTTTGNITLNSRNTVSLSGAVNAGSGIVSINANSDGAGAQGFTMNAGSSIATTNIGANAVQIIVNSPVGGTGAASLRGSITTGNGGTATVSTRGQAAVGGNITGGAITQGAVLTMNTGAAGTVALATGAAASSITLNTAGNNFTGAVGVSRAFNVALRDANALVLGASTISGTLGVTTAGALTQTGALTVTGTTTLAAGAANNITLSNAGNNFSTVAITNGNNVALTDANALVLGASTVSGTLGVTTAGALTQSGVLTVTGVTTLAAGAANNINLATSANNFSTVTITSGNNVSLRDTNALVLGASTVSGALALTTGGALSQSGALNVTGATSFTATAVNTDILLGTQANNFGGAFSFAGTLGNFRDVSIRNVNAGATVPALAGLTALRNLTLTYNNAPVALPALTLTAGGNLNVTAGGAITDIGNLIVPGTTTLVAGANNITLDNANNFTGAVSVTSGNNVALNDINALVLGPSTVSGTLNVTTAGAVTQTGALAVTGATTVAAGAANNITLNNAANNFSTVGITSGNNVALTDANALNLGISTIAGTLGVTTAGALTQTGALTVTGATTLAAGAANNITLGGANNFSTVAVTSGNNVTLNDTNALILGASTISGTLGVTTNGALTQSGALSVTGTTTFAAGAANDVTLNNAANNFSTVAITSGNNVALTDANVLDLGASTVSGNLALTTGGTLTQTGALAVTGTTSFTATTVNTDILLGTQANNFGGALSFAGTLGNFRDVSLRNVNAGATVPTVAGLSSLRNLTLQFDNAPITLPTLTLTAGGNLNVTAGGTISQSGVVTIPGTTTLATTVAGSDILLNTQANNFGGAVSFGGTLTNIRDVGLRNVNAGATVPALAGLTNLRNLTLQFDNAPITLPTLTLTAGGNLNVTAGGTISQSGVVTIPGTTTLATTVAGSDILLNTQANNFGGAVSFGGTLTNIRDVGLRNVNAGATIPALAGLTSLRNLTLHFDSAPVALPTLTLTAGGNLNVTAGGAITDIGNLIVPGTTTLVAGANNITLDNANDFTGAVSVTSGNNVALNDINALVLGPSTVSGTLNVTTVGAVTQTGALAVTGATTVAAGAANNITLNDAGNNFSTVGITSGNNVALTDTNALVLGAATVSGNLALTTGGTLTQTGALAVTGTTTLATTVAASDILLDTQANNFVGAVAFGGTQSNIRDLGLRNVNAGATVPVLAGLTNLRNLTLTFDNAPMVLPTLTASGNLTAIAGGLISQSGALSVAGSAGFNTTAAATLGSVNLANGGALTLNTSTVGGNLTVTTAAGDLTLPAGQTLTVVGDATLTSAGTVNLLGTTRIGGTQSATGGGSSTFTLGADTNLNALALPTAGNITVNTTGTTATFAGPSLLPLAIDLNTAGNNFGGPVSVTTAAPAFTGTTTNTYNLTQSAPVNLNVGQGLTVTDLGGTAGTRGNITLTNAGNIFNTVTFTGGNIAWAETGPVTISGVSANAGATSTGTLSITATGPLTQTGAITAAGATTLAAGAANDITLTDAANNFSTVGITSGNTVALNDLNALDLAASTVSGNLTVTTGGAITDSGNLAVTGTTTLAAGAGNNITLDSAGNNFSTVGITSGNDVTLADANALNLAASTVSGNLTATTGGTLTQSGAVTVTGTTTLASTAANSDILLDTQANNFIGAISFGGIQANIRDVSLRNVNTGATVPTLAGLTNLRNLALTFDAAPINLPTLNVSGNLSVTAGGSITQSGAVTVTGTTTLATTVAASDILLDTQANNFVGAVAFGGTQSNIRDLGLRNVNAGATVPVLAGLTNLRNLTLTFDNAPMVLPTLTASGNLTATAGGTITQTGALTIAGITTLAAGANDITLTDAANNFSTVGITSGNNVSLTDATALNLGASTISGTLTVTTTGGALTQSGALNVAGITTLAAMANDITLNDAGNNFSAVGVTSGNNVTLTDANALTMNASTASGNIAVSAGDLTIGGPVASTGGNLNLTGANTVTQSANLTVAGGNTITVTTTTGPIAMAAAATTSSGTGAITYTAGTDVTLGSLSTGGAVNVTANGGSVLSAVGSGTNVTAGANSTLQAFNGVVGTTASPMTVNVNPGTLGVLATTAVAGISVFINGTVLPSNALTLLNVPPGLVCFNGCPVPPSNNPLAGFIGVIPSFNLDSVVPWYLHQPSDPPMRSVFSTYLPKSVVAETEVDVTSNEHSVAREIPPCFPEEACTPSASILAAPADGKDPELHILR